MTTRRDAIAAELAAITTSKTSHSIDGHSMQHDQHRAALVKELGDLNKMISEVDGGEVRSHVS